MARDTELALDIAAAHAAGVEYSDIVSCEGGFRADIRVALGAIATTADTLDIQVQASIDGSNYFQVADFPQIIDTDDNIEIARSCYIPPPTTPGVLVLVRLRYTISAGGSCTITWAFVEPLTSLAPADIDVAQGIGLAMLT